MTDQLREEIAIIKSTFPELELAKASMAENHFNFMLRNMALAYQLAVKNTLASIQKEGKA